MRSSIFITSVTISLAAVTGIVIGLVIKNPASNPSPESASSESISKIQSNNLTPKPTTDINELASRLNKEISARQSLEKKVRELGDKLEKLTSSDVSQKSGSSPSHQAASAGETPPGATWFNQQALLDAGIEEAEASRIKNQFENLEMEKLYLRDRAIREGWSGDKRYREELKKLDSQIGNLEEQLGDKAYSAYLYAVGRSNRVEVQNVLSGSPADIAGMRVGDQITKYDNERIYNWSDLRSSTSKGTVNETVMIEVEREGKKVQIYVPRGPLGIRMNSISVAP